MSFLKFNLIIFAIDAVFFYFYIKKFKCPKCGKISKAITYREMGVSGAILIFAWIAYDLYYDNPVRITGYILLLVTDVYLLFSAPTFYCRHCMKGISFDKKDIVK